MKIVSQSQDEMVLKDGSAFATVGGGIFILLAGYLFYALRPFTGASLNDIWFPVVFLVIGSLLLFLTSTINVSINKTQGQIVYKKARLIGGSSKTYATADAVRVELRKQWETRQTSTGQRGISMPQQVLVSQSIIIFKDGTELPIDHAKSSSGISLATGVLMGGQGSEQSIANQVATFLGIPFQEIAPQSPMGINIGGGGMGL